MGLFSKNIKSTNLKATKEILKINTNATVDGQPAYYGLQRAATVFKKNGQMDMAIACLRRSNELSDMYSRPPLLEKDYLRLIKFLQQNNDYETAETELNNLYKRHPKFTDKRISNLIRIKEVLSKARVYKCDTVYISTNNSCPICSKYNRQKYSIKGNKYPKLPLELAKEGGFDKNCIISISLDFELS